MKLNSLFAYVCKQDYPGSKQDENEDKLDHGPPRAQHGTPNRFRRNRVGLGAKSINCDSAINDLAIAGRDLEPIDNAERAKLTQQTKTRLHSSHQFRNYRLMISLSRLTSWPIASGHCFSI